MKTINNKSKSQVAILLSLFFVLLVISFAIATSGCLDSNGNDEEMSADEGNPEESVEVSSDEEDDLVEETERVYFSTSDDTETEASTEPSVERIVVPMTTDADRKGKKSSSSSTVSTSTSPVTVSAITVTGDGSATSVIVGQALQMNADVMPSDASDRTVTWSVMNGTGNATVNAVGLLTAIEVGNVTVKATAHDVSGVAGTLDIRIDPVSVPDPILVTNIVMDWEGCEPAVLKGETIQLTAEVDPSDATDSSVSWSVINATGEATIDQTGLLTAIEAGDVNVKVTANDASGVEKTVLFTIYDYILT